MAIWKSAAELTARYLVGSERLADYSRRGNLPSTCGPNGEQLFDAEIVARLFRLRNAVGASNTLGSNLGVLGEARLGICEFPREESAREARRRALRLASGAEPDAALGRTGST